MKQTKSRKLLAILLTLMLSLSLLPLSAVTALATPATYGFWDLRNENNITVTPLNVTLDSGDIDVTWYAGYYAQHPIKTNSPPGPAGMPFGDRDDQKINIYVPENAKPEAGVLMLLINSSWAVNVYPTDTITDGSTYSVAANPNDRIAQALERGMIVVSYGCRSRSQTDLATQTEYVGHSPATMSDTKAAIRFLKYNFEDGRLLAQYGDPYVFITGHSGGGALTALIAASGNSPDFYSALFDVGAAGIEWVGAMAYNTATLTDKLNPANWKDTGDDSVFATISSAPITDLGMADQAYEFTFSGVRGQSPYKEDPVVAEEMLSYYDYADTTKWGYDMLALSAQLKAEYEDYISDLFGYSAADYYDQITKLLETSIEHELYLAANTSYGYSTQTKTVADWTINMIEPNDPDAIARGWYTIGADGSVTVDQEAYFAWIINLAHLLPASAADDEEIAKKYAYSDGNELKGIIAFNSDGLGVNDDGSVTKYGYNRNENNLYGLESQPYSIAYEALWDLFKLVGNDITASYADYDEFHESDEGQLVAMQIKMAGPIPYLMGSEKIPYLDVIQGSDVCDVAPYWFVRHGMGDIDTSLANIITLYNALESNDDVLDINIFLGWDRSHISSGLTYYAEAFEWVDGVLAETVGGSDGGETPEIPEMPELPFMDIESTAWYYDYVEYVFYHNLMLGSSDDEFSPSLTSSRAMIVTVLWRMAGSPAATGTNSFADLTADWYRDAVQWAVSNGITNGMSDTSFAPNDAVTREQLATFLYRYADFMGYDISEENDLSGYADAGSISNFAKAAMAWANAMSIITGESDTTLNPKGASTRAVLATVLTRFCESYSVFGEAYAEPDADADADVEAEEAAEDEEVAEDDGEVVSDEEVADEAEDDIAA